MQVTDEAELSAAIAGAAGPLRVKGGGTRGLGRTWADAVLDVSGLTGVTLYEPAALTLVVKAGTTLSSVSETLLAERQRLAFEPLVLRAGDTTIGGIVATNASGPRRIQVGACRDFCLGVRFVDGTGQVVQNGGRVMKNVTGYDLVKLMAGSWGTLGVLSEVSLKVMPMPETEATLILHGLAPEQAVAAMSSALGSPFEVTAATHVPARQQTWLRVEGFETQVKHRVAQLKARLAGDCEITEASADWDAVRTLDLLGGDGDLWRMSVRPSDAPGVVANLPETAQWIMDWGGGLIWARVPAGWDARTILSSGHATLMDADPDTHARLGTFQSEPTGVATLSAGLRAQFDPKGILNPGLMG